MQEVHSLDARGCPCPQPLIKTRKLWKTLTAGERFEVIVDNDIAHINLVSFLNDQSANPEVRREGSDWIILATRTASGRDSEKIPVKAEVSVIAKETVPVAQTTHADYVVVLKSEQMGLGDEDLGSILMQGYLNTLRELDSKPSSIILYNSGVLLASEDSGAVSALQALIENQVDVIVCGACVDFYGIKDKLAAGRISNMYEIAEKLAQTGHVVYP